MPGANSKSVFGRRGGILLKLFTSKTYIVSYMIKSVSLSFGVFQTQSAIVRSINRIISIFFAGLGSVHIVKNCDGGLENTARGLQ